MLNADRAKLSLPTLQYDERLADVARAHSADMRDHKFFRHESRRTGSISDRLSAARVHVLAARENLADSPTVGSAQAGLLKSPGHYANIMADDITHVGVGIVRGGKNPQNLLFTQVFARPFQPESPAQARERVLNAIQSARKGKGLQPLDTNPRLDALAAQAAATLPAAPGKSHFKRATKSVFKRLEEDPIKGLKGLSVNTQSFLQGDQFKIPSELLAPGAFYGLSVRQVKDKTGGPLLVVLVLVGR